MPNIYDKQTNQLIGSISEAELEFLAARLEEESSTDQDYYVNLATVELLVEQGAPVALVMVLRDALAGRDDCEIRWTRD
jgi:hypothetical protein